MARARRVTGIVVLLAVGLAACSDAPKGEDQPDAPVVLTSDVWRASVTAQEAADRIRGLNLAVDRLRDETSSGWVGRQDDLTGYLTELEGGRFDGPTAGPEGALSDLFAAYGSDLFGIGPSELLVVSTEPAGPQAVALRAEQQVRGIPVLDGAVVATVSGDGGESRVNAVRGRVFPGMADTDTEPTIDAAAASDLAAAAAQGEATGEPSLVVLPIADRGALAWEVSVIGPPSVTDDLRLGRYYIDAQGGQVLLVRPGAADLGVPVAALGGARGSAPGRLAAALLAEAVTCAGLQTHVGDIVEITGTGPIGEAITARGLLEEGTYYLIDVNPAGEGEGLGGGAICTHDGLDISRDELPGDLVTSSSAAFADGDAIAAHAFSRFVVDEYGARFGRDSWDGQGGELISSVHFGGESFCNAFFSDSLDPPQMVYGPPCVRDGEQWSTTMVDIDVAGHEITHGVTATSAGLLYVGQSGALNESFSDYFGNLLGDALLERDSDTVGDGICADIEPPTPLCNENPDGSVSLRFMSNGTTFGDYAYLLSEPQLFRFLGVNQDWGGVHLNSSIWNNALWTIRKRLAAVDGGVAHTSERVAQFDRIVYGALTRYLTPSSGFLDARSAVEQAATEEGADATTQRVIAEVFDENLICTGCADPPATPALPVATTAITQRVPAVSGDRIAWIELSGGGESAGQASVRGSGGLVEPVTSAPNAFSLGFAGDALVTAEDPGIVMRYDLAGGVPEQLDDGLGDGIYTGIAGSDEGAAWFTASAGRLNFVDDNGEETSEINVGRDFPSAIATDGGVVVTGGENGTIVKWEVGQGPPEIVTSLDGSVFSIGISGDRVVVTHGFGIDSELTLVDLTDGSTRLLSEDASPFGVAIDGDLVVWSQVTGLLGGQVAQLLFMPDTDLYLYSFASGRKYRVLDARGQQGFPALSGNQLVWQDAGLGGDDIFTGTLPDGL